MSCDLPVRKTMCGTCPFRDGSPYSYLRTDLSIASLGESRICHSTGAGNAINEETGKPEHICRGSRDLQLRYMHDMKIIAKPTDEAWNDTREAFGMPRQEVKDP